MNSEYYYCSICGIVWKSSDHTHDAKCPSCHEYFLDDKIECITEKEYEELKQNTIPLEIEKKELKIIDNRKLHLSDEEVECISHLNDNLIIIYSDDLMN